MLARTFIRDTGLYLVNNLAIGENTSKLGRPTPERG